MTEREGNEIEVIQIGPVKYSKEEERTIAESWAAGLIGIPLGVIAAIFLGLIKKGKMQYPLGVLAAITPFFICLITFWWLATIVFSLIFWRKINTLSRRNLGRIIFPTLVMPLFMLIYILPIMVFIFDPLNNFLLQYYSPYGTFWIGFGVFFPFMLLYVYLVLPHLRPRMRRNLRRVFTRGFWREAWGKPKSRREIKIMLVLLGVLVFLHLLPLWK